MNSQQPNDYLNMPQKPLPNATAVLVLGIISIVVCSICGIIGLVLANQDLRLYNNHPEMYTEGSLSNLKAGRICSIIGVVILGLSILYVICVLLIFGSFSNSFR
ncbi:MAG: CCC motif membrane protein [Ferruginibacter sp.]